MQNQDIIPSIKKLLDRIDAVISGLNEEGARLFSEGKYDQARALLNKVEAITGFRGKVLCLKDNWKALRVPALDKTSGKSEAGARPRSEPLKPGLKTGYEEFRYPILEALVRLDGIGRVRDVFRIIEEIMADQLNIYDYQPLPSNPDSVRWKNTVSWERYNMVQDGLLADNSPRGVWEITDAGRQSLKHAKANPDIQRKLFSEAESSKLKVKRISSQLKNCKRDPP
ncbi:MAG: winged helix-turn-helix domain-containing protein [Chloroflexota bacterium]|nr:winged helix-turn-helix domain-containing protein [Chloroflexota bacterium]